MGIDAEFRVSNPDINALLAVPEVFEIYAPDEELAFAWRAAKDEEGRPRVAWHRLLSHEHLWVVTTCKRGSYPGYGQDRGPMIADLIERLRPLGEAWLYGGDNGVPFVEVDDELVAKLRARWE